MSALLVTAVAATFLLAGLVKGVIGLGLPTVAVGLLGLMLPPAEAAALLVVPSLVTNVWQLGGRGLAVLLRRLWPMLLGIAGGTWAGSGLIAGDAATMSLVLGLSLILYAIIALAAPRLKVPPSAESFLSPLAGALTGAVTAATGILVIPAAPYLQALALDKDALVQAMGLSFTVSTAALAASLAHQGLFHAPLAGASTLALLPALLGMWAGQLVRQRMRPERFRLYLFIGLLAVGAHLALRPLL